MCRIIYIYICTRYYIYIYKQPSVSRFSGRHTWLTYFTWRCGDKVKWIGHVVMLWWTHFRSQNSKMDTEKTPNVSTLPSTPIFEFFFFEIPSFRDISISSCSLNTLCSPKTLKVCGDGSHFYHRRMCLKAWVGCEGWDLSHGHCCCWLISTWVPKCPLFWLEKTFFWRQNKGQMGSRYIVFNLQLNSLFESS